VTDQSPIRDANGRVTVLVVVGTRPEAIKQAPVYRALSGAPGLVPRLVSTGQHTDLLRTSLAAFDLVPDYELSVMTPGQSLAGTAAKILERFEPLVRDFRPAAVLVQGDTTTAFAAGLASYYCGVPVGHVEAGLRTYDHTNPFPEEGNRQLLDRISRWCFPPTETSRQNLLAERVSADRVTVTGNTGIDALLWAVGRVEPPVPNDPYVLVTLHRRESFGEPLRDILRGLSDFLAREPSARAVWPVHPNPAVLAVAETVFGRDANITRLPPQDYLAFAKLMAGSRVILTDSGGVQEEAPSLGKRVLIARETTERPEAVTTGQNRLVGRDRGVIAAALRTAWDEPPYTGPLPAPNPYGEGRAADEIVRVLCRDLVDRPV
jgi:UDP-N-acetylglucosamine 2-epimerase (non-hydrolysing)